MKTQITTFHELKTLITKAHSSPLQFFQRHLPVTIQADASKHSMSACLLQNGKPIAFALKSLTDANTRYASIERELLTVVYTYECPPHLPLWLLHHSSEWPQACGDDWPEECNCHTPIFKEYFCVFSRMMLQLNTGLAVRCSLQMPSPGYPVSDKEIKFTLIFMCIT